MAGDKELKHYVQVYENSFVENVMMGEICGADGIQMVIL